MISNPVAWTFVVHLTGVVFWIGGLFMALAAAGAARASGDAAHSMAGDDAAARKQRAGMADRALRRYAHPGAALVVLSGALLLYLVPPVRMAPWLHVKLLLVAVLIGFDVALTLRVRRMPEQEPSAGQIGMFHGSIALLFVLILVMVLVQPF